MRRIFIKLQGHRYTSILGLIIRCCCCCDFQVQFKQCAIYIEPLFDHPNNPIAVEEEDDSEDQASPTTPYQNVVKHKMLINPHPGSPTLLSLLAPFLTKIAITGIDKCHQPQIAITGVPFVNTQCHQPQPVLNNRGRPAGQNFR